MIFQSVNFDGQMPNTDEVEKMCREHPGCNGCPLKSKDMNIQGTTIVCVTGRNNKN